jgi:hypothetical protein
VPSPLPPDDPEAWYAPDVQAQYEVHPGVVVTVTERDADFSYGVREPVLTAGDREAVEGNKTPLCCLSLAILILTVHLLAAHAINV